MPMSRGREDGGSILSGTGRGSPGWMTVDQRIFAAILNINILDDVATMNEVSAPDEDMYLMSMDFQL